MKNIAKKAIIINLILITLFISVIPVNYVQAGQINLTEAREEFTYEDYSNFDNSAEVTLNNKSVKATPKPNSSASIAQSTGGILKFIGDLLMGLMKLAVGMVLGSGEVFNIKAICFGEVSRFSINFFDLRETEGSPFVALKNNIAIWYNVLRTIAIIALLCVLIYVGIRMTISTIGGDKAKYKKMLIHWVTGFALLFVLHYVIILAINLSEALTGLMSSLASNVDMEETILTNLAKEIDINTGWNIVLSIILYCMIVIITLKFFLLYYKRIIVVAFLIIIAPIICITYPLDKLRRFTSTSI